MAIINTQKQVDEAVQRAIYPLQKENNDLKALIEKIKNQQEQKEKVHDVEKQKIKNQYEYQLANMREEVKKKEEEHTKKIDHMNDMLDRFAAKNFENAKRHEHFQINFTRMRRVRRQKKEFAVATFEVLLPVPVYQNSLNDTIAAWNFATDQADFFQNQIATQTGHAVEIELMEVQRQKESWLARYEIEYEI